MEIVNKVAKSGLVTIDLQKFYDSTPIHVFDIADHLFHGLILKEQDFRTALEHFNWAQYKNHYVSVICSTDAIVAPWAFMLVASHAQPFAKKIFFGTQEQVLTELYKENLQKIDWSTYKGKKVLLKGCSDVPVPASVYTIATHYLLPFAERLMYGEACSFVPVFRKMKTLETE